MSNKFILLNLNQEGEIVFEQECKSLKVIESMLNLPYHQVRLLYLHGRKPSKLHPFLKEVSQCVRIIDNPKLKESLNLHLPNTLAPTLEHPPL
jgi:hypothetical protein